MKVLAWVLMMCCTWFAPTDARADARTDAESHFRAGVSLQKLEDFDAAIAEYEASLQLYPTKNALFNLANCQRAVHRYVEALETLERLDEEFENEIPGGMRAAMTRQKEELGNLTASVTISVSSPDEEQLQGARVEVDGAHVGVSPLAKPIRLKLGPHELVVSLNGYQPARTTITLRPAQQMVHEVVLQPDAGRPSTTQPNTTPLEAPNRTVISPSAMADLEPAGSGGAASSSSDARDTGDEPTRRSPLQLAGYGSIGVGAALFAASAATGLSALTLDGRLEDSCDGGTCPPTQADRIDRFERNVRTTDILLGLGTLCVGAGVTLLVLAPKRTDDGRPPAASLHLSVGVLEANAVLRY